MRATVLTDASFSSARKGRNVAGWASWIRIDDHPLPIKAYGAIKKPCQNSTVAEVYAALNGIWIAVNRGADDILLRSDCMAVEHLIQGQARKEYLLRIWAEARYQSAWGRRIKSLRSQHVKGHADPSRHSAGWVNDWCDKHAKQAMRQARKGAFGVHIEG